MTPEQIKSDRKALRLAVKQLIVARFRDRHGGLLKVSPKEGYARIAKAEADLFELVTGERDAYLAALAIGDADAVRLLKVKDGIREPQTQNVEDIINAAKGKQ